MWQKIKKLLSGHFEESTQISAKEKKEARMNKGIIQSAFLLVATLAVVNSVIVNTNVNGRRRREAHLQSLPMDCEMEFNVAKRDGSNEVDFVVCVKNMDVCTSRQVKDCSADKGKCEGFKPKAVDDEFKALYKDAYAKVCEEPDGELCLYTDIKHRQCGSAKGQGGDDQELCVRLEDGKVECAKIPGDKLRMIQSFSNDDKLLHMMAQLQNIWEFVDEEE